MFVVIVEAFFARNSRALFSFPGAGGDCSFGSFSGLTWIDLVNIKVKLIIIIVLKFDLGRGLGYK